MPKYEILSSLEREGFYLNYPDNYSNEEKIIEILKEKERRLYLAIPLLLEKEFDYKKIKSSILKLKEGRKLLEEFNKIILITEKIFKKTRRNTERISKIIGENKIKSNFSESEFRYYLEEFLESRKATEIKTFDDLDKRKKIDSFKALEIIFSPAKIRILRKIYEFKELTPTEKMYYYRAIKPFIESILNRNLQEYLEVVKENRKRK